MRIQKTVLAAFLVLVICVTWAVYFPSSNNGMQTGIQNLPQCIVRNEQVLLELMEACEGEYIDQGDASFRQFSLIFSLPLRSVDYRNPEYVAFLFSDYMPEGTIYVYYCREDQYQISSEIIVSGSHPEVRVNDIGSQGKGYIFCKRLLEKWYYVESYLPT